MNMITNIYSKINKGMVDRRLSCGVDEIEKNEEIDDDYFKNKYENDDKNDENMDGQNNENEDDQNDENDYDQNNDHIYFLIT